MNDLSLQIGLVNPVKVRNGELSDSCAGKVEGHGGSQPPHTDDQHTAFRQSPLPLSAHLGEFDLPAVAFLFCCVHGFSFRGGAYRGGPEIGTQYNDKSFCRQVRR